MSGENDRLDTSTSLVVLAGLLRDHTQESHLDLQRTRTRVAHLGPARDRSRRPAPQHRVPQVHVVVAADPVVLACAQGVRQRRPGQVLAVRDRHVQGATPGIRQTRGHERSAKVPNPSGRPRHVPFAVRSHVLQSTRLAGLREFREAKEHASHGHTRVLNRFRACLICFSPPSSSFQTYLFF